jgi:hypothetical protein
MDDEVGIDMDVVVLLLLRVSFPPSWSALLLLLLPWIVGTAAGLRNL